MTLGLGGGAVLLVAAVGASAVYGRYLIRPRELTAEKVRQFGVVKLVHVLTQFS